MKLINNERLVLYLLGQAFMIILLVSDYYFDNDIFPQLFVLFIDVKRASRFFATKHRLCTGKTNKCDNLAAPIGQIQNRTE